jgi:NitT/TauT family transport system permease protein
MRYLVLKQAKTILGGLLPVIVFLVGWEAFSGSSTKRAFLFASPSAVLLVAWQDLKSGVILAHASATCFETVLGLAIGSVLGSIVGFSLWIDPRIGRMATPYIIVIGAIPIFAVAPLLIIWFGTGLLAKVVMASSTVFIVSLVSGYNTANRLMKTHDDWLHGLHASRTFALQHVIFPEALRSVFEVARLNVGFAILGSFIAEFISSNRGIGFYILKASGLYDTARVLFGVFALGVLALALTVILYLLERTIPALRYSGKSSGHS